LQVRPFQRQNFKRTCSPATGLERAHRVQERFHRN
jgi:hypothetical protein